MPVSVLERELAQIAAEGGCSIFWLTETQARARRLERAERAGRLVRRRSDPRDAYPWMVFTVTSQETYMENEVKTELLHVRIDSKTREAIRLLALRADRTEASMVRIILRREAQAAGLLTTKTDRRDGARGR